MALPDFQSIMLPLLKLASDQGEHSLRESIESLALNFRLSDKERGELLPSGQQAIFDNRVGWAKTHLTKAGLLEITRKGFFRATQRGLEVVQQDPAKIDLRYLQKYPEFIEFRKAGRKDKNDISGIDTEINSQQTPEESLEYSL